MEAKATQIKIINQAHYNYHDIIRFKDFESKFSKIDRKQALIKRIDDYERICSVISIGLLVLQVDLLKKGVEINT